MGFFDRFKKKTPASRHAFPEVYEGIISPADYSEVMDQSIAWFGANGRTVLSAEGGEIVVRRGEDEEERYYLDNLVRNLKERDRSEWEATIRSHFERTQANEAAYEYIYKDWEFAAPLLRILVKADDVIPADQLGNHVYRVDLPGTHSFLVIEHNNQFRFVSREEAAGWEQPETELFRTAETNLPVDEIEAEVRELQEGKPVFCFYSGDFAASLILTLEESVPDAVGTFGSLVAVPSKGFALAHPIEDGSVLNTAAELASAVQENYDSAPSPISPYFYWYHGGTFESLPATETADGTTVRLPDTLRKALG